jgi:hypothetical protein
MSTHKIALVVTMAFDDGTVSPTTNGVCPHIHGKPTAENLAAHVKAFEAATRPEGVNAHLGETKVVSAKIVRQNGNVVLATYQA